MQFTLKHQNTPTMQKIFIYLLPLILLTFGCEQVIDMDLNEAAPQPVIEADLSHPDGLLTVTISKTGSYFESSSETTVDNAKVMLENREGIQKEATAQGNGNYKLAEVLTKPGDTFKLLVQVDGIDYSAVSTIKAPVAIDSISYGYYDGDSFFRPGYRFNVTFTDPIKQNNYYRIRVYKNNYLFNRPQDLVAFSDTDLDGQSITVRLNSQYYLEKGEQATLELLSIDRHAWEYFTSLSEIVNASPDSPAPANPVSNFSNGALGYFYAWSYDRKTVVIEE